MPSAICFIEKLRLQRPLQRGGDEWESGNWNLTSEKAEAFVGKRIYFHAKKGEESYFGGVVTGYRVLPSDHQDASRIVIRFTRDEEGKGFVAGRLGWGKEYKTIP